MCGIAGIIDSRISSESLEAKGRLMMQSLYHRGPDADGLWRSQDRNLVLVHRRLSIQDLSDNGDQPMLSSSKRFCVVFNGEIYNFRELAERLSGCGHQFVGHSDTEVLLAAIEEWGIVDAVKNFVGMFAFALWDREQKIIHLCRDRVGEKPLYYGWAGEAFYFASELKAIETAVPKNKLKIDVNALSWYFKNGFISAPLSIYEGVYKLVPGSILSIPVGKDQKLPEFSPHPGGDTLSPKIYWSVVETANQGLIQPLQNESEVIEQLDNELHRSIRRQMIADVDVGAFLSGGVDSSVVSAIAQHVSAEKIRTYTIGFSEKEYDESSYAEKIAEHLGTEHLALRIDSKDSLELVPDLMSIYDEPFADSSQIPSYLVAKLAREHVTVCLAGDGGDELFAGYNRYVWTESLWSNVSHIPTPIRKLLGKSLAIPSPQFWDDIYNYVSAAKRDSYNRQKLVGLKVQKLASVMQKKDIFQAYDFLMSYWENPENLISEEAINRVGYEQAYTGDLNIPSAICFIDQAMLLDQSIYLPGDTLAKVDRSSMAVGLETRLPLLSHEIVDLSWRIPASMKVKNNVSKWALRQVLYKYVPQELIDRPKMGFSVPIAKWLRNDLKAWAEDLIGGMESGGMLQKSKVQDALSEHLSCKRDHSHKLWSVLMFLSWDLCRKTRQ